MSVQHFVRIQLVSNPICGQYWLTFEQVQLVYYRICFIHIFLRELFKII